MRKYEYIKVKEKSYSEKLQKEDWDFVIFNKEKEYLLKKEISKYPTPRLEENKKNYSDINTYEKYAQYIKFGLVQFLPEKYGWFTKAYFELDFDDLTGDARWYMIAMRDKYLEKGD